MKGFTLIEAMILLAMLGIILAAGIGKYEESVPEDDGDGIVIEIDQNL